MLETIDVRNESLDELYAAARDYGENIASWQDMPEGGERVPRELDWIGIDHVESADDAREYLELVARAAEENARQFSPAEQWINALNAREDAEEAWEQVEAGIDEGIQNEVDDRMKHWEPGEPDYWVCQDCLMVIANGDYSGLDYGHTEDEAEERAQEIDEGLATLPTVTPWSFTDYDEEFSRCSCDCCGTPLAGSRHGVNAV